MKKSALLIGLAALLAAADASASTNAVSFAGRLSDSGGPVDGSISVTFKLFPALTGGTAAWTQSQSLTADNGLVYAELGGATDPLDPSVFDGSDLWLEITIGSETLSPRLPIDAVPYAATASLALTADTVGAITPSQIVTTVAAGAGLSGGGNPSGGTVTLSVDTSSMQQRVTGSCAAGSAIASISSTGTVTCETDDVGTGDITDVTASTGLSGGGSSGNVSLSVNPAAVQTRVGGTCAAGSSIRVINQDGTVTCETDDVGAAGGTTSVTAFKVPPGSGTAPTFTPTLVRTYGSFTKNSASTVVTVTMSNTVLTTGTFCQWQLRIDGTAPLGVTVPDGYGTIVYNNTQLPISQTSVWTGLAAGSHSVQLYLRGSGTTCQDNAAGFTDQMVFVTEE